MSTHGFLILDQGETTFAIVPVVVTRKPPLPGHFWYTDLGVELVQGLEFFLRYEDAEERINFLRKQSVYSLAEIEKVAHETASTLVTRFHMTDGAALQHLYRTLADALEALLREAYK